MAATGVGLVATIAVGAVAGAAIAGSTAAASTAQQNNGKVDWETVGLCVGVGAAVGALASGTAYGITKAVTVATSKAVKYGHDFGKTGKYVKNPNIKVDWNQYAQHGTQRMTERGMSKELVNEVVKKGYTLSQSGDKYLFLTEKGAAVVTKTGKLVTTYGKEFFDDAIKAILKALMG